MNKKLFFLSLSVVYLNILDLYTTWTVLSLGGKETNALLLHLNEGGIGFFDILIKVGIPIFLGVMVYFTNKRAEKEQRGYVIKYLYIVTIFLNIFYLFVVIHNIRMLNFQIQEVMRFVGK